MRYPQFTDAALGMEFVLVKGGCFEMGDTAGDGDNDSEVATVSLIVGVPATSGRSGASPMKPSCFTRSSPRCGGVSGNESVAMP